jgi:hypothetical protein
MANGEEVSVLIVALSTTSGTVTNKTSVTSDTGDPNPGDNNASEDTTITTIKVHLPILASN